MDPLDAGLRSHCMRVAAWAHELAADCKLSPAEQGILAHAAALHHVPFEILEGEGADRLTQDIWPVTKRNGASPKVRIPADVRAVLAAMAQPETGPEALATGDQTVKMARLVELANLFDEQLEMAQLEGRSVQEALDLAWDDPTLSPVLRTLRKASRAELLALIPKLPVYPAVAIRALATLSKPDVHIQEVEQVSKADQVLAGQLLRAANSAFYSPRTPLKSVRDAITFIGMDSARIILSAAALRPLLSTGKVKRLWTHSIETAQLAERIAALSGSIGPHEAFLAGLVHDIGRLAISLFPADVLEAYERLLARGCEITLAETVLFGLDHAEAGAEILQIWKFPREMVDGIRHHHNPDRTDSRLAALLYVTEFWNGDEEDLPSNALLCCALQRLDVSMEKMKLADLSTSCGMEALIT